MDSEKVSQRAKREQQAEAPLRVRLRKSTPRDLYFEDVLLPRWAHEIDVLPISILGDLSFRFSHWFFRFTVCAARVRRSPTFAIRRHCRELLRVIDAREAEILEKMPVRSSIKDAPREVLGQWRLTLERMIELSAGKKSCTWYADGHPSDPLWPGLPEYVAKLQKRGYLFETDLDQLYGKAIDRISNSVAQLRGGA